jgi:hypothetical protein
MVVVPAVLKEIEKPVALKDRPQTEQKELIDKIGKIEIDYKINGGSGPVGEMIKIAKELGYHDMWIYWRFTEDTRKTVNIPLLAEIARQKNYKNGWVYFAKQRIQARMKQNKTYREILS